MMKKSLAICSAVLTVIIASTNSTVLFANATGGIGGRPANPDPTNPRTTSIFVYTLKGGDGKKDAIYVNNATGKKQVIDIYAVDGVVTNTGSYTCRQKSEPREGLGSWVKLAKNEVVLEPNQHEVVDFTVTVPQKADVGEHMGCIAMQSKTQAPDQRQGGVQIYTRQAVRMAVIVPGDIKRDITISKFNVGRKDNTQNFDVALTNKGNVSADVEVEVTLKNLFGGVFYKGGGQQPVLPETTLNLPYTNQKAPFWGGWYLAESKILYDKRPGVFGLPDSGQLITKKSDTKILFFMPSWIVIAGFALFVILVLFVIFRKKRRKKSGKKSSGRKSTSSEKQILWGSYIAKEGETVKSLARKHNISWEKLATINRLAPPYEIKAGQKIYVPKGYKK